MKPIITKLTLVAVVATVANPAFASRGAGGVHSNDSDPLAGYNRRMQQEDAKPAEQAPAPEAAGMQVEESPESGDNEMPSDWPQSAAPAAGKPDGFLEIQKQ